MVCGPKITFSKMPLAPVVKHNNGTTIPVLGLGTWKVIILVYLAIMFNRQINLNFSTLYSTKPKTKICECVYILIKLTRKIKILNLKNGDNIIVISSRIKNFLLFFIFS